MEKKPYVFAFALALFSSAAAAGTLYNTEPASNVTQTSAQLNGAGLSTLGPPKGTFDWGLTIKYGQKALANPQGVNGNVSAEIDGLKCGTTYHYRLEGVPYPPRTTTQGKDMTFTTDACPKQYVNIDAGPIWNQQDSEQKCPNVCTGAQGTWSGQWVTTVEGQMSVCGCWVPESKR